MISIKSIMTNKKILVLADQAVFSGSSFLTTLLTARMLSVSDFGLYTGIILVLFLLISVSNALIVQPFQVSYPGVSDKKSYQGFAFWLQLTITLLIAGVIVVMSGLQIEWLFSFQAYTAEICSLVFSFLFYDFFRKIFLAKDQVFSAFLIDVVSGAFQLILLSLSYLNGKLTLSQALYITGFSYLCGSLLGFFQVRPTLYGMEKFRVYFKNHVSQGKWLFFTAIIQWWSSNLFVVASGIFLGSAALGAFRLVQSLFGVLNVLLQSYENYALPEAVRYFQVSTERSKDYLRRISIKGVFLFGSVLLVLFLFSEPIIQLAGGEKYVSYAYVLKGMAVLYFIIFLGYPIRMAVRMMMMNNILFMGYAISFVFSLLMFNFLLKEWQLWGVLIGLITNQLILISFWQYCLFKKQFVLWK
jgi:O-antigen/teichoic acid export membrane protein